MKISFFRWKPLSAKQKKVLCWWNKNSRYKDYNGIIADGAIRSGKTVTMGFSFVLWAMTNFDRQNFAMCGKTIASFRRNVLGTLKQQLRARGYTVTEKRSENLLVVSKGNKANLFYIFGGKDEASQDLIQGITLAGVLFDEVALMPESFVNQATARCSVTGSKFWFNCNPAGPMHWFYVKWICRCRKLKLLYLHFTMADNLSLAQKIKERYESMWTGVFYDRYIRGLWVAAEGLVYPMFDKLLHVVKEHGTKGLYFVSMDYGTANPTAMGLWRVEPDKGIATMEREYYHNSREKGVQKTDEEYYQDLVKFVGDTRVQRIIIDPAAASMKECIRRHGRFSVLDANNNVLDGIRFTGAMIKMGNVKFHESCKNTFKEFGLYSWDEKATQDTVIKENDHSMDQMRYLFQTLRHLYFKKVKDVGN